MHGVGLKSPFVTGANASSRDSSVAQPRHAGSSLSRYSPPPTPSSFPYATLPHTNLSSPVTANPSFTLSFLSHHPLPHSTPLHITIPSSHYPSRMMSSPSHYTTLKSHYPPLHASLCTDSRPPGLRFQELCHYSINMDVLEYLRLHA